MNSTREERNVYVRWNQGLFYRLSNIFNICLYQEPENPFDEPDFLGNINNVDEISEKSIQVDIRYVSISCKKKVRLNHLLMKVPESVATIFPELRVYDYAED